MWYLLGSARSVNLVYLSFFCVCVQDLLASSSIADEQSCTKGIRVNAVSYIPA